MKFLTQSLIHRFLAGTGLLRIVVLAALLCLAVILHYARLRAAVPFELDYEEGNILNAGLRLMGGPTLYPDPRSFPYILNPYGPAGYILTAAAIKSFGLSLPAPRMVVLFAGIAVVLLITVLAHRFGGLWQVGLISGVLYLCSPGVRIWFPLLRVDYWAIALSLSGLYVFAVFRRGWPLASLLFALAILTKHVALAAPAACLLELIFLNKVRRATGFAGLTAGAVLVTLVLIPGNPFFHLLDTHPDPYSLKRLLVLYGSAAEGSKFPLAIIIYAIAFSVRWTAQSRLAWLYLGLCSVTTLTAGKLGSETNHFLEWTGAVCLVSAIALSALLEKGHSLARVFTAGLAGLTFVFTFMGYRRATPPADTAGACTDAYAFVRSFPGTRILSEDVAALVLTGKPVSVSNPFVVTQLEGRVAWSEGTLDGLVDRQYFQLILLGGEPRGYLPESGRWSLPLMKAIEERYRLERRFACAPYLRAAFVPKPSG